MLPGIAFGIAVFAVLLVTLGDPGVTWDEVYPNIEAAKRQAEWLSGLFSRPDSFSSETIDKYWKTTSDHPSLPRVCAAVSYLVFGSIIDELIAFRIPSAVLFSVLVATVFFWCRKYIGSEAGWAAALFLPAMPRVFAHAHFYSLDVPIMCWWTWTLFAFAAAIDGSRRTWLAALVYAVAFATKLHAVFLPPLLLGWVVYLFVVHSDSDARSLIARRVVYVIGFAVVLVPLVYLWTQPWLWYETIPRIQDRFLDYAKKSTVRPIGLWYLGERYFDNTPWHYPLVMTAFTIPIGILIFVLLGLKTGWKRKPETTREFLFRRDRWVLIVFGALVPMLIVVLPLAQGYDGVRLWLPAFPCLAILAGYGYQALVDFVRARLRAPVSQKRFLLALVVVGVVLPASMDMIRLHPCQLAYYNGLCGGAAGAQQMGFETTYWCDALTKPFLEQMNDVVQPGSSMRPMAMSYDVIGYWQQRGMLNADIHYLGDPPYDYHLLQCRQGMFTNTEWFFYRSMKPLLVQERDGVPLFMLFGPLPK